MKKTIALLAAVLLLLPLAACGGTPAGTESAPSTEAPVTSSGDPTVAEHTTAAITTEAPAPQKVSLKDGFRVINSTKAGTADNLNTLKTALLNQFNAKKSLYSYTVVTDTANDGHDGKPEVVLGNSNRPECAELYPTLGPLDWVVAVKNNRILLLGGSAEASSRAINWFMMNCVVKSKTEFEEGVLHSFTSPEKMPEIPIMEGKTYDCLKNLHVYAIGDSYFAGDKIGKDKTWLKLLADKYKMTFGNFGLNGSTVSDYDTAGNPMVQRISAMTADPDADIIFFEGGANDWNHAVPMGTVGSKDTKDFCGAVASCLEQLHARYPKALIICFTPWDYGNLKKVLGFTPKDYAKTMMQVVAQYDYAVCIDDTDTSAIPAFMTSEIFRVRYCQSSTDLNHFNEEGMQMILPFFEKRIAEYYTAFKK